jgi:Protein of unknown function (DUF4446)
VVSVLLVGLVVALGISVVLLWRVGRLSRRLEQLTRGSDESSLEAVLGQHLERVRKVVRDVDDVAGRTTALEKDIRRSLGRVGLVRYNPFDDTGGNQSFALAIVDGAGDGFVVSSLHARQGTRVYAKSVTKGSAEVALSEEEAAALQQALEKQTAGPSR